MISSHQNTEGKIIISAQNTASNSLIKLRNLISKIGMNNNIAKLTLYGILASMILLAVYFLVLPVVLDWTSYKPNLTQSNPVTEQKQPSSLLPTRLKIPRISVDAVVEYVGVTPEGRMDVPKGPDEVAWYKLGSRPGEIGSAVIAGHSGWKNFRPAVFDNLNKLKEGDKIYIEDEKGETITFVVREKRLYDPTADSTDVFISSDGKAHLNLITCEGVWDEVTKSRSKRLVVFTDREIE